MDKKIKEPWSKEEKKSLFIHDIDIYIYIWINITHACFNKCEAEEARQVRNWNMI